MTLIAAKMNILSAPGSETVKNFGSKRRIYKARATLTAIESKVVGASTQPVFTTFELET